jgi:hypothetical protein
MVLPAASTTERAALSLNQILTTNKYISAAKDVSEEWQDPRVFRQT